jgi:glutamate-5-semialdehyde dehydrogenase
VLPGLEKALSSKGVVIKGCSRVREIIDAETAADEDWGTEYLDLIVSIKVVDSAEEAVDHINRYGSKHTDAIVTSDRETAQAFMDRVDSASVMWNCSTRFADGFRYGLGAEVGISTSKIHARGPVGIEGLMTYKWKLQGTGQIVADYTGEKGRRFTHKPL